jgi:HD-like signal output (HDOD) protein
MKAFWLHGLATGMAARVIGMRRGEMHVERLFVAGVLHDVGRLVIYRGLPDLACNILSYGREHELLVEVERKLLGFDHADVGGELLRTWHLPEALAAAAAFHHRPDLDTTASVESATIHLADIVAHSLETGNSGYRRSIQRRGTVWVCRSAPWRRS